MNGWGRGFEPSTDFTFFFWFYPLRSSIYLCLNFVAESNKIATSSQLIIVLTTLGMPLTTFPFLTCHSPPMEKVAGEQGLALQQLFPYKSSYFFEIQTIIKSHSLMLGTSNFCHFGIFDMLFPFLAFFKL